ncbi:MAG: YraN family protein [Treponema sp.]|nr:YraN family protein [Treponema sp.]
MNKAGLGKKGEDRAAEALETAGMSVIARNFRSRTGEIDIIALDGDTLVFVEVKAWSAFGMENLSYSLSPKKQGRIVETAKYFLSIYRQYYGRAIRFDVVFVGKEAVTHLASAFMERI